MPLTALYGSGNIIPLLTRMHELPPTVRFLLMSRQDIRVMNAFQDADIFSLSDAANEQHNQEDIRRYVKERLGSNEKLAIKAAQFDKEHVSEKIVEILVRKAEGNFLYARFLLDSIAVGKRSLTDLDGFPEGLDGLYFESLQRVIQLGKGDWYNDYASLMGMLSVVQENPTLAQFQSFTGQSTMKILKHLDDLGQLIEEVKPPDAGESHYRLYHQSVIDFFRRQSLVIQKNELRNTFYLPNDEWHKELANWCERGDLTTIWKDMMLNQ